MTKALAIAALGLACCLSLPLNLNCQDSSDVASQIKQLQQESRDAQMKNDVPWAQQHLADGFIAGNSWRQETVLSRTCRTNPSNGRAATSATSKS